MKQVIQRAINERGRSKNRRINLNVLEARPQGLENSFDLPGNLQSIPPGLLLDDQQKAGTVIDDGITNRGREPVTNLGNVFEPQRHAAAIGYDRFREILG